ncbi:MAG: hypothetical protein AAGI06_09315, partial [Pseudomonadota bacterium]
GQPGAWAPPFFYQLSAERLGFCALSAECCCALNRQILRVSGPQKWFICGPIGTLFVLKTEPSLDAVRSHEP